MRTISLAFAAFALLAACPAAAAPPDDEAPPAKQPSPVDLRWQVISLIPGDGKGNGVAMQKLTGWGRVAADAIVTRVFPVLEPEWFGPLEVPDLAREGTQTNAAQVLAELRYAPATQVLEETRASIKHPQHLERFDASLAALRAVPFRCSDTCANRPLTADLGTCGIKAKGCKGHTPSGMLSACDPCARRAGTCALCKLPVPGALPEHTTLIRTLMDLIPGDGRAGGLASRRLTAWGAPAARVLHQRLFPRPDVAWLRMDGDIPGEWLEDMQTNAATVLAEVGYLSALPALEAAEDTIKHPQNRKAFAAAIKTLRAKRR